MDPGSKNRLTPAMRARFSADTLFDRVARTLCAASVLPRKELYETWEVARRARRRFTGGVVLDACAGHGLYGFLAVLLDDAITRVHAVDVRCPPSFSALEAVMVAEWPRLAGRVVYEERVLSAMPCDRVVSIHACGALSDRVIDLAISARASLALLPCCHARGDTDAAALSGWLDPALALDSVRVLRLTSAGYRVVTQQIDPAITEKNRLILATAP
jgi:hypothetical protein